MSRRRFVMTPRCHTKPANGADGSTRNTRLLRLTTGLCYSLKRTNPSVRCAVSIPLQLRNWQAF